MNQLEPQQIRLLVVHCSATPPEDDIGATEIRHWHTDLNGWSDMGYHAVIRRDGRLEDGRPLLYQGAHARGWNSQSWGVCLIGGVTDYASKTPAANYTVDQYQTLWRLLDAWRYLAPAAYICGHRDLDSYHQSLKACPSFDVRAYYVARHMAS